MNAVLYQCLLDYLLCIDLCSSLCGVRVARNFGFWQEFILPSSERTVNNLGFWRVIQLPISIYVVLRAGRTQFEILAGVLMSCLSHFMLSSERASRNLGFWRGFLLPISLYVVLGAGRAQFGILAGVSDVYLTLCSPQSGPRAIRDFEWVVF